MYNLPYYKEKDKGVVLDFMRKYPFAFVAGCAADGKPVATQLPFLIEERDEKLFLCAHVMRQTDHHKAFEQHPDVLCVFTGPHTYVSATWYDNPSQASTWNYMSVHVQGIVRFLGEDGLVDMLQKTSLHFENNNPHSSTTFDNLPADYTQKLMKAIVAFEVEVTGIDTVFKLSQNHDSKSYQNIIEMLAEGDGDAQAVAMEMKNRKAKLFG
ncbi:MAG: FMN-binding negative transcriptional regulator [Flaviaesturariibacter sp.]|nr:FMN-binding negative transcriptional regulator [Flaviaesturariibacter sp.]